MLLVIVHVLGLLVNNLGSANPIKKKTAKCQFQECKTALTTNRSHSPVHFQSRRPLLDQISQLLCIGLVIVW